MSKLSLKTQKEQLTTVRVRKLEIKNKYVLRKKLDPRIPTCIIQLEIVNDNEKYAKFYPLSSDCNEVPQSNILLVGHCTNHHIDEPQVLLFM